MSNKPNLIYIFADQLRYDRLGCSGDGKARTPNIDRMASESAFLENCISGHPVCAPYRASLLTGKYTTSTGMVINEIRINPCHRTLPKVLKEYGYTTSYLGKWHLYANQFLHHYDVKNSYIPEGEHRLGFDEFTGYNFHHEYYAPKAYYHKNSPEKIYCTKYEPDQQTDMAIETLTRLSGEKKPFAFFLSLGTPHDPWTKDNVPEEYYRMFENVSFPNPDNYSECDDPYSDHLWARLKKKERQVLEDWRRVYYAMVANLDYNIGRLNKAIESLGLNENSIIVFSSDHGEMFGSHGRRAKNIFYEEAVRVPFLIKGKGIPNVRNTMNLNSVDIMPTLLSLMEIPCPEEAEGKDRSSELKGTPCSDEFDGSLMMGTGPVALYWDGYEWRGWRTKQYTYAVYRRDGREFLFDNINDRCQLNNLCGKPEYAKIINEMKSRMYKEMERIGDDFEKNSFYRRHWVKNRCIKEFLPRRKDL